jgi:hypothetical protein
VVLLFGLLGPAFVWIGVGKLPTFRQRHWPTWVQRRITDVVAETPWLVGGVVVYVLDHLAFLALPPLSGRLGWSFPALPYMAMVHAAQTCLAFAGLALARRPGRRGVQRTVEDERRRIVAALVALREARVQEGEASEPSPEGTSPAQSGP